MNPTRFEVSDDLKTLVNLYKFPWQVQATRAFDIDRNLIGFSSTPGDEFKPIKVSSRKQKEDIAAYFENPSRPLVIGVSCQSDEGKAIALAGHMALGWAIKHPRVALTWQVMNNTLRNPILNDTDFPPSFIVLSNIKTDSPIHKIEKVRDILSTYDRVPRIVVVHGSDPVTFFYKTLKQDINMALYLTTNKIKEEAI